MRTRSVKSPIAELSSSLCSNPSSFSVSMCFSFPRQFDYDFFSKPPSEIGISLTSGFFLRLVRPKRASTLARGGCRRGRQDRRQPSEGASDVDARFGGFWLSMPDFLPLTLLGNSKGPFGLCQFQVRRFRCQKSWRFVGMS